MHIKILALISLSLATLAAKSDIHKQSLSGEWQFRQARTVQWHSATVPGTVHTDLMAEGLIPDPFIGLNERAVQWVDKEDWIYEKVFDTDSSMLANENVSLVFEGLDTYADVYLNDSLILRADNMFRLWELPVKLLLRPHDNKLSVYFHSPIKVDLPKFEALPFRYDAGNDQSQNGGIFDKRVSVFARKAGYHYGWDWGPRLVTSGIWRPVYLKWWSGPVMDDVFIATRTLKKNKALMNATVEIVSDRDYPEVSVDISDSGSGNRLVTHRTYLMRGHNRLSIPFEIKNPRLWWCNGLGSPNLYDFHLALSVDRDTIDTKSVVTGIRQIEVVRDNDNGGRTFYFRLNGCPVFAKGANYIPCDNFLPRVTDEIYSRTVKDAADANMNMLRVWGGGIYENDTFYNQCDSLGIMVWQDFMFACSLYPSEGLLLESIRKEAEYNVKRLRNHPSISLWCGNNECLEAWYNWGLRRRYEKQGVADIIWKQYLDLYHGTLPYVVKELNPEVFYWPSSPYSSVDGSPDPDKGDAHLWRVWGGEEPVEVYNQATARFFSEYGFQSFPDRETVLKYAPDTTQHFIDSDVMLAHQRAGTGANRRIEKYLLNSYPEPKDFNSLLYMSQVLQGDAIKTAIEAHRRNKPYCMGTLFWQHNDCWPVASWSSRDYYGKWKAQHYFAKKAFADILVSTLAPGNCIDLYLVSDKQKAADGTLRVEAFTFDGNSISSYTCRLTLPANDVKKISIPKKRVYASADTCAIFIHSTFTHHGTVYESIFLPASQKLIRLSKPEVNIDIRRTDDGYTLDIASNKFVRAFKIGLKGDVEYFLDDNYFDLLPGRHYSVRLTTAMPASAIASSLYWTSLYQATHSD